jgi:hypothetical protein
MIFTGGLFFSVRFFFQERSMKILERMRKFFEDFEEAAGEKSYNALKRVSDFFSSVRNKIKSFFNGIFSSIKNFFCPREKTETDADDAHKKNYGAGFFFDFVFDLIFSAGIVVRLKPDLFFASEEYSISRIVEMICNFLGEKEIFQQEHSESLKIAFFIFAGILASYLCFKIGFALFAARGSQKIVSVLCEAMTVLSITFVDEKFLLFVLFYFLLYVTYQISCGIRAKGALKKLCVLVILDLCLYVAFHAIFDRTFREALKSLKLLPLNKLL